MEAVVKRVLLTLILLVACATGVSAQYPPSWNRLSAVQQAVWKANCQPPSAAMANMCAALGGPGGSLLSVSSLETASPTKPTAVAVCSDGQRFSLPSFETSGLTANEIDTINHNNGVDRCKTHGRFVDNVLKILPPGAVPAPTPDTSTSSTAAPRTSASAAPASTSTPPTTSASACAENGSCYGDTSAATGKPKTTYVQGYTRRDGTYVRGHYRSN